MAVLEVRNLVKTFGAARAVDDVSFTVDAGEILVIVGGSGCGKTTTLRCIAGLEDVTAGTISLEGKVVASATTSTPPERRGIGMVFQSYALWPHKTVAENVAYGLQRKGQSTRETGSAVAETLAQVGLADFANRYPSTLSGGQQQRVALARSAVVGPKLLLLDEPLSNLDAKLREQMRDDLGTMIRRLGMTAVHITHDQSEAMALADRVICMRGGRIEQIGTPRDIYRRPTSRFVADFLGSCSFLAGQIVEIMGPRDVRVRVSDRLVLKATADEPLALGATTTLALRPASVTLSSNDGLATAETLRGRIVHAVFLGSHTEYKVDCGGVVLKAVSLLDLSINAECSVDILPGGAFCLSR